MEELSPQTARDFNQSNAFSAPNMFENLILYGKCNYISASPLIIYALQKERLLAERHVGRHVMHHSKISNGNYNFKNESFIKIGKRWAKKKNDREIIS